MTSFSVRASLCALFAALALYGCASDDTDSMGGAGGAAGATGGVGGATGGAGGTTGGASGAAGMTGGMGGGGAGGIGGGGAGGMAGAGGGMSGDEVPGCDVAVPGEPAALHEAAAMAIDGGCGFPSCHDGDRGKRANLGIPMGSDLNMLLVDKASCEVPTMPLVKSGGGDEALANSWIWQKVAAPDDASFNLIAKPEWGTPSETCGNLGFGTRMPMGGLDLSETRVAAIRNWICAGAAGP